MRPVASGPAWPGSPWPWPGPVAVTADRGGDRDFVATVVAVSRRSSAWRRSGRPSAFIDALLRSLPGTRRSRSQSAAGGANEVRVGILAATRWGYGSDAGSAQVLGHYDRIVAMLYKLTHSARPASGCRSSSMLARPGASRLGLGAHHRRDSRVGHDQAKALRGVLALGQPAIAQKSQPARISVLVRARTP